MKSNYKRLGDFIQQVKLKNSEGKHNLLLGINIDKYFMPSVANIVGTDLTNYKLVKKDQFACNRMHVGRDYRIPIALSDKNESFIVSPAYTVFEIINKLELLPEYLMMWFSRKEFDRNAWFHTDADVRGGLPWELFCELDLPIPSIQKQHEIVKEYNTIVNRIKLNEQLNQKLEETAQAIYKYWFVDFEFPDEKGKPYNSNGGDMYWCEELGKDVPVGWRKGTLGDLIQLQRGFDLPTKKRIDGEYPIYASTGVSQFHKEYRVKAPGIVTGRSGSLGEVFYVDKDFWPLNTTLWVKEFKNASPIFTYFVLKSINIEGYNSGSAVPTLNRNYIHMHELVIPNMSVIESCERLFLTLFKSKKEIRLEIKLLTEFQSIILSNMT